MTGAIEHVGVDVVRDLPAGVFPVCPGPASPVTSPSADHSPTASPCSLALRLCWQNMNDERADSQAGLGPENSPVHKLPCRQADRPWPLIKHGGGHEMEVAVVLQTPLGQELSGAQETHFVLCMNERCLCEWD